MDDLDTTKGETVDGAGARWMAPSTAKERSAVERAVARLLDELAPERVVSRRAPLPLPIERDRTPRGCVLQAPTAAVSVSWFPDQGMDAASGELHVAAWRGVVSQPGSARRVPGASVVRELLLQPVDRGVSGWEWRATDGTLYDTDGVVGLCLALLEAAAAGGDAAG